MTSIFFLTTNFPKILAKFTFFAIFLLDPILQFSRYLCFLSSLAVLQKFIMLFNTRRSAFRLSPCTFIDTMPSRSRFFRIWPKSRKNTHRPCSRRRNLSILPDLKEGISLWRMLLSRRSLEPIFASFSGSIEGFVDIFECIFG